MPTRIALIEPTTAVGREAVALLLEEGLDVDLSLFGSAEAAGEELDELRVKPLDAAGLAGHDIVIIPPGAPEEALALARRSGALVFDAFTARHEPNVPLISPFLNDEELDELKPLKGKVVALPGPAAAQAARVLLPLHARHVVTRVNITSLEAASGAELPGVEELSQQTVALLNGRDPDRAVFPQRLAFNLVPQVGALRTEHADGELELSRDVKRLLGAEPSIFATSIRAPVFYGFLQVMEIVTERPITADDARQLFRGEAGVKVLDDPRESVYPMPILTVGDDALHVGRIRAADGALHLVAVADNVRWGAAVPLAALVRRAVEDELL